MIGRRTALPLQMYGLYPGADPSKTASYAGYMHDVRICNCILSDAVVATQYVTALH